jgi:hypothetical protein
MDCEEISRTFQVPARGDEEPAFNEPRRDSSLPRRAFGGRVQIRLKIATATSTIKRMMRSPTRVTRT